LLELFDAARAEWTNDVTTSAVDRFERRLTGEISGVRVLIGQTDAALRTEMATLRAEMREGDAGLRAEMREGFALLRADMREGDAGVRAWATAEFTSLRLDMKEEFSKLRQEMAAGRFELIKWCFAFWVGQIVAIGGLLGVLLRVMR
jgi:hypothetical protein